jgi:hypothetical protein
MTAAADTAQPVRPGILQLDPPALLAGRCAECGELRFPAGRLCPSCGCARIESVPLGGEGTIFSFSVVHMAPPGYLGEAPYAVGVVELPDGIRITATILAERLEQLAIGDRVGFELLTLAGDAGPLLSFAYRKES